MRIFLDANILFSAAKSAGAVRDLLARAQAAGHALCADAYVVAEAHRNLAAKSEEGFLRRAGKQIAHNHFCAAVT